MCNYLSVHLLFLVPCKNADLLLIYTRLNMSLPLSHYQNSALTHSLNHDQSSSALLHVPFNPHYVSIYLDGGVLATFPAAAAVVAAAPAVVPDVWMTLPDLSFRSKTVIACV